MDAAAEVRPRSRVQSTGCHVQRVQLGLNMRHKHLKSWSMYPIHVFAPGIMVGAFVFSVIFQNMSMFRASGDALAANVDPIDMSWPAWRASVLRYEGTRARDEGYSTKTHQDASEAFLEGIRDRHHSRTVHWSAVRLICETMKMTVFYVQQEQNREQSQRPSPIERKPHP